MKYALLTMALSLSLATGLIVSQSSANAQPASANVCIDDADVAPVAKKCGFDSDCSHGKCKSGKCGSCGFDSDCKGWGKCKSGKCGACGFDSDCKGFGKCKSGNCEKSPY